MNTICIISGSHLCRNPRVVKEANLLSESGFSVTILTIWTKFELIEIDRSIISPKIEYIGINFCAPKSTKSILARLYRRALEEINIIFSSNKYGAFNYKIKDLLKLAINIKVDFYMCHQETGLYIGYELIRIGKKVGFDIEDWYSHDFEPTYRKKWFRNILINLEYFALKNGILNYTTSLSLSEKLSKFYCLPRPEVIRNSFPITEIVEQNIQYERLSLSSLSITWFSQTVGKGRGLEDIFNALKYLTNVELEIHIRGYITAEYKQELMLISELSKNHKIIFHPPILPQELQIRLREHDIGLALERNHPESRNYTITNKIFQFMQAGLAVIATNTEGQKEVYNLSPNAIILYETGDAKELSKIISNLYLDRRKLLQCKTESLLRHKNALCWEIESNKMLQLYKKMEIQYQV